MPWIMMLVSMLGFSVVFSTKSVALLIIGLLIGIGAFIASIFGFAAARISANSRSDATLLTDQDFHRLRASIQQTQAQKKAAAETTEMQVTANSQITISPATSDSSQ